MKGLSLLATIISVLSFPMAFMALMYPHIASPSGRWKGFFLYGGISVSTLGLAVWTASSPKIGVSDWVALDWLVLLVGGILLLAAVTKRWWGSASSRDNESGSERPTRSHTRNRSKSGRRRRGS